MIDTTLKTPLEMFYHWEATKPDSVYLRQPVNQHWTDYSWAQVGQQARRMAAALQAIGPPGSSIGILSANCAHWFMADLAIMMSGHVTVPYFITMGADAVGYVLDHSGTQALLVGRTENWNEIKDAIAHTVKLISLPGVSIEGAQAWEDLVADHEPVAGNPVRDPDELFTIIYTSGTTGLPKGVEHTFGTLGASGASFVKVELTEAERFFSYLPLAHCAERVAVFLGSLYCGGSVGFNESLASFNDDLRRVNPTIFFAVPRIWTKFQMGIQGKLGADKLNQLLTDPDTAETTGLQIRQALGLGEVRIAITGAAPTPLPLHQWYERIGLPLNEFYGQTELLPISCNLPWERKPGTIGKALAGIEIKIAGTGEILVSGPGCMKGYYRDPEKTAETLVDGWIHTGDRGELDEDGFLKLTGRVTEIFKTTKGKYVAPMPIESHFAENPYIEQVCLAGAGLPETILLAVLSEAGRNTARNTVSKDLRQLLEQINAKLEHHERISHILLSEETWTIENNLMTPTMKIKRGALEDKYMERLVTLSESGTGKTEPIVWE
jgi:long-chain acyl-CoA synthetase